MKVPNGYVKSKCCHAYQNPTNETCIVCGNPFKPEDFESVVKPVMEWLRKNRNPHAKIIIDSECAEMLDGVQSVNALHDATHDQTIYAIHTPKL